MVSIGAGLIGLTAAGAFLLLPQLQQIEYDPGTPRAVAPRLLHPAYWVGADAKPAAGVAFERTELAPGAQQTALLGAPMAAQVQALMKQGHECDTGDLVVYSRSGRPKSLIVTDCRAKRGGQPEADHNEYPTLLVLEGENLRELHGLEAFGFSYDTGTLVGVTDLNGDNVLQLWLGGSLSGCDAKVEGGCDAQGSIIVADTPEGLQKQDYTMDASCPDIRAAEDDGKASCVCGPALSGYRDSFLSPYAGLNLAAVCGYSETEGPDGKPQPAGVAYFSGFANLSGALINKTLDSGAADIGFAEHSAIDPATPGPRVLFTDNATALAASKSPMALSDDPCWSAPAAITLRVVKSVVAAGVAPKNYVQKYSFGKIGKFRACE